MMWHLSNLPGVVLVVPEVRTPAVTPSWQELARVTCSAAHCTVVDVTWVLTAHCPKDGEQGPGSIWGDCVQVTAFVVSALVVTAFLVSAFVFVVAWSAVSRWYPQAGTHRHMGCPTSGTERLILCVQ